MVRFAKNFGKLLTLKDIGRILQAAKVEDEQIKQETIISTGVRPTMF